MLSFFSSNPLIQTVATGLWLFSNLPNTNGESIALKNAVDFNKIERDENYPLNG
jgi:hypothetical protein